jgi:hypothetical protein
MKKNLFRGLSFLFCAVSIVLLGACAPASSTPPPLPLATATPPSLNKTPGVPEDQRYTPSPDGKIYTAIPSEGAGPVAVQITLPVQPRYPEGAGVLVEVPPYFTPVAGYQQSLDTRGIGILHVTFLWPGCSDPSRGHLSAGARDYGGAGSIAALRDVIRFASGELADTNGKSIADIAGIPLMAGNTGLYAFSHPGLAAVSVMASYGYQLTNLRYFVGRENPTIDAISSLEIGYVGADNAPLLNPGYRYPESFRGGDILLDYSAVRWDPELPGCGVGSTGAPYFDGDGNGRRDPSDYALGTQCPSMFGKRVYSAALTQALDDQHAFAEGAWPADLALPDEARDWWSIRESPGAYPALSNMMPRLKIMLVFGERDHAQAARDKPHIHQAWLGFTETAGLWVRLNPDSAYAACLGPDTGDWRDHPAESEPEDWLDAYRWGHPDTPAAAAVFPLAAAAEMADRVYYENWASDFDKVLGGACRKN